MKRCQVCTESEAKYRCPRCDIETCCLVCVKQHKVNTDCSGERDKTAYVKLNDFDDRNLLNDYRFLEDAGRKNNNAARDVLKRRHNRPNFLRELEKQAGIRKINLRLMPYPMSRRKNNSTSYQNRLKKIFWQIEWIFAEVDLVLVDKRICEEDTLESVLEKHIGIDGDPLVRHKLKPYISAGRENLKLFLKYENTTADKPLFYQLDMTQSLLENLRFKHILEYPSIHVVLPSNTKQYDTVRTEQSPSIHANLSTAGGELLSGTEKMSTGTEKLSTEKLSTEADKLLTEKQSTETDKLMIETDKLLEVTGNVTDTISGMDSKNENVSEIN